MQKRNRKQIKICFIETFLSKSTAIVVSFKHPFVVNQGSSFGNLIKYVGGKKTTVKEMSIKDEFKGITNSFK